MKILVISNLYPPFYQTGYELGCRAMVDSLMDRQHKIQVLTSVHGMGKVPPDEGEHIHRKLVINDKKSPDWKDVFFKEFTNQTYFKKLCLEFDPEMILFFDLTHISLSLHSLAREFGIPSVSYFANNWFITPERDQWHKLWPKDNSGFKILRFLTDRLVLIPPRPPQLSLNSVFANSHLRRVALDLNRASPEATVVPLGIDLRRFPYQEQKNGKPSRLLYAGKIHPDSGIDDVFKAIHLLIFEYGYDFLSLTIAGDEKSSPGYTAYLRDLAEKLGISNHLKFSGFIPHEKMSKLYRSHDILVSPSLLDTSANRTILEAMSSGIAIVSSSTESKREIIEDETHALIYPKEDAASCADRIRRLLDDHEFLESIRKNARHLVEHRFHITRSIESLEAIFTETRKSTHPEEQEKRKQCILLPVKNRKDLSFDNLKRQANRWMNLGKFVVFVRILTKPGFYLHFPKQILKKALFFTPHSVYALMFNIRYFLHGQRRKNADSQKSETQKILVMQLADIGDLILTSPFLRELRRSYPKAWIGLAVQPRMLELAEKCPYVDEVIVFDWRAVKNVDSFLRGSPRWWVLSSRLAKKHIWKHHLDMAISNRWNEDPCQAASMILMYTSGAAQLIAYRGSLADTIRLGWKDLNRLITRGPAREFAKHEVEHQLDVLNYLGISPEKTQLEVWTSREDDLFAQTLLNDRGITAADRLIAFAPGAAWPFRRWPSERFIELGRWLQETYQAHVLILAAKNEQDLAHQIEQGLHGNKTINLAGKTSLREMASVLKRCTLFIGNDSGPLHIAAAAGIPVVGFYGPGEYQRFKPWGVEHDVLRLGLFCSPCSQHCIFDEPRCIKGLDLKQAKNILARRLASILDLP